ncbi:hypothetical protein GWK47_028312 [Chionoecetes opilio]|uniref:Uncharacterized protein n=1 Tax=Chionoecetes opilio TaxID=41210 RepID=A0A8J4YM52_CHIOP|nr:hypothetical protein GWK47_028312 [Chionoecetes opilio]
MSSTLSLRVIPTWDGTQMKVTDLPVLSMPCKIPIHSFNISSKTGCGLLRDSRAPLLSTKKYVSPPPSLTFPRPRSRGGELSLSGGNSIRQSISMMGVRDHAMYIILPHQNTTPGPATLHDRPVTPHMCTVRLPERVACYKRAHQPIFSRPKPYDAGQGWEKTGQGILEPVWSCGPILPSSLADLLETVDSEDEQEYPDYDGLDDE